MSSALINKQCLKGLHPLKVIYTDSDGFADIVIRWCPECGAIVIDNDVDNRIYPGKVMPMKLSRLYQEIRRTDLNES
jgi:hypothetical protein